MNLIAGIFVAIFSELVLLSMAVALGVGLVLLFLKIFDFTDDINNEFLSMFVKGLDLIVSLILLFLLVYCTIFLGHKIIEWIFNISLVSNNHGSECCNDCFFPIFYYWFL